MRQVLANTTMQPEPLWLTEFGWGSAQPDRYGINQGVAGQQRLLKGVDRGGAGEPQGLEPAAHVLVPVAGPRAELEFAHRCSFCGSAGLLKHDRSGKPAFQAFKGFTAETKKPTASITAGPKQDAVIKNPSPSFSFSSSETGSTFQCHVGATPFRTCSSRSPLATSPTESTRSSFGRSTRPGTSARSDPGGSRLIPSLPRPRRSAGPARPRRPTTTAPRCTATPRRARP